MLKTDLEKLQYQMFITIKKYHVLMGKRVVDPSQGATVQKEIKEVLYQLIALNDRQKIVVDSLRQEKYKYINGDTDDPSTINNNNNINNNIANNTSIPAMQYNGDIKIKKEQCEDSLDGIADSTTVNNTISCSTTHNTSISTASCPSNSPKQESRVFSSPKLTQEAQDTATVMCESDKMVSGEEEDVVEEQDHFECGDDLSYPDLGDEVSCHKNRLERIREDMSHPISDDVHDLVTPEEFMHALGLLTVRECQDVVDKRRERRKNQPHSHVFSSTLWEKHDTKKKKRVWLMNAGSPPQLRRKIRPTSQPSSRQTSRPGSPSGSTGSSNPSLSLSQPESPDSTDQAISQAQSPHLDEICPICKIKGAEAQCDGCGVVYHGSCVSLPNDQPPPGWLCQTCEELGLRASNTFHPYSYSRRRGKSREPSSQRSVTTTAGRIDH